MNSNDSGIRKADEIISALFDGIDSNQMKESLQLLKGWNSVVSTISTNKSEGNKLGQQLASHSKVIDLKNGNLLVETDHPAYIQMFQTYKTYILRGLKMKFPKLEIISLSFRLKGSEVHLHDIDDEKNEVIDKKETKSSSFKVDENLPPELKERFEMLKKGILTKDKKM